MNRTSTLAVVLLVAVGGFWLARTWVFGEEGRIRARLDELAEAVSIEAPEPYPARLGRAVRIGSFFTEDVAVQLGAPFDDLRGRDTIVALATQAPVPEGGAEIEFVDVQVWIGPAGQRAEAVMTVTGSGIDRSGEERVDAREIEVSLAKVEGTWLIAGVRGVDPLESPLRDRPEN